MTPLACPFLASILLMAFPAEAFSRKGIRTFRGLMRYLGHTAFAGLPGAAFLWAVPEGSFEAAAGLTMLGVLMSGAILLPGLMTGAKGQGHRPARQGGPLRDPDVTDLTPRTVVGLPVSPVPANGDMSPWLSARVIPGTPALGRDAGG